MFSEPFCLEHHNSNVITMKIYIYTFMHQRVQLMVLAESEREIGRCLYAHEAQEEEKRALHTTHTAFCVSFEQ